MHGKQKQEAKKFRAIRSTWFRVPTIAYGIALVTCLICNLALNRTLSWFLIVLSAVLCAYTFIPTVTGFSASKKLLVFAASTYLSVCLLLLTCGIYTHDASWIPTACIGILPGYVLLFAPLLLANTRYSRHRFVFSFAAAFLLTVLLLLSVRIRQPLMLGKALLMAAYGYIPVIACAMLCTLRCSAVIKAGLCTAVLGLALLFADPVANALFAPSSASLAQPFLRFFGMSFNSAVSLFVPLSLVLIGSILLVMSLFHIQKDKKK